MARRVPGSAKGTLHGFKEQLPKPTLETLLTQNPASLDHENRFYEDNKRKIASVLIYDDQAKANPEYGDKKSICNKVTSRDFIKVHKERVVPPPGYREAVPELEQRPAQAA